MFIDSFKPFMKLCGELKPKAILVCGLDNSGWLARGLGREKAWEQARYDVPYEGGTALAARMPHPSSAIRYEDWRPTVDALLEEARKVPK